MALAALGEIAADRDDWTEATAFGQRAVQLVDDASLDAYWSSALVFAWAARITIRSGRIDDAQNHLARAARLRPLLTYALPVVSTITLIHMARAYVELGDTAGATTAYYKSGELPLLLLNLGRFNARHGIPFWVTAVIAQHGTKIVLLAIPIFTILIPLGRSIPTLYVWIIRRRLLRWYDRLKALETTLDRAGATPSQVSRLREDLERIDSAVSALRIPRRFSNQLYELRSHINLVQQRLSRRPSREKPDQWT
jgi:hypothetical protein